MYDARYKVRRISLITLFITLIVNAIFFLAPLSEPADSVHLGEEGGANIVDQSEKFDDMNPFARSVYLFGDATCHQKASRSFFINGNQMPVCARDVGIYLGLTLGVLVFMVFPRRFSMWWLAIVIAPFAIDGMVQLVTAYESNNALRLMTGSMYGGIIGVFILMSINEIYDVRLKLFGPERWLRRKLRMPEKPPVLYQYRPREPERRERPSSDEKRPQAGRRRRDPPRRKGPAGPRTGKE